MSVEDTGVGLSKEAQQRMFERFWRERHFTHARERRRRAGTRDRTRLRRSPGRAHLGGEPARWRRPLRVHAADRRAARHDRLTNTAAAGVFRKCSSSRKRRVRSGRHRARGRGMTPARLRRFDHEATSPRHPARASPGRSGGLIRQCLCRARLLRPTSRAPEPPHQQESFVVGHAYVNDNTAPRTPSPALTGTPTARSPRSPAPRFPPAAPDPAPGWPRRARSSFRATDATCSRSTPRATRSRCCGLGSGGVPQPVGAPVSSGGSDPVSIAVSGNLVYVANAGASEPNVTGFYLAPWGALYPLPHSTVALPAGSGPDDVLFDPTGQKLVVPLVNTSTIASFHVGFGWPPARRPGLALRGPGTGTVRLGVPADEPLAAVRQQCSRRRRQRDGLGLQRELLR